MQELVGVLGPNITVIYLNGMEGLFWEPVMQQLVRALFLDFGTASC